MNKVFESIIRCPNVALVLKSGDARNPCTRVISSQRAKDFASFQMPEPWSSNLETAPLLFLSSNPSISDSEQYPSSSNDDAKIEDFFVNRFGGGRKQWILNGTRCLKSDQSYGRPVQHWIEVRSRASELFSREAVPGIDYALSEVVHCKSKKKEGVSEALEECTARYLRSTLSAAAAKIIVALGREAQSAISRLCGLPTDRVLSGPLEIERMGSYVVLLAAPGSNKKRSFTACLSPEELWELRTKLLAKFERNFRAAVSRLRSFISRGCAFPFRLIRGRNPPSSQPAL
jgi:uracil-DNA glycosylase